MLMTRPTLQSLKAQDNALKDQGNLPILPFKQAKDSRIDHKVLNRDSRSYESSMQGNALWRQGSWQYSEVKAKRASSQSMKSYEKALKEDEKAGRALELATVAFEEARKELGEALEDLDVKNGPSTRKAIKNQNKATKTLRKASKASDRSTAALIKAQKEVNLGNSGATSNAQYLEQTTGNYEIVQQDHEGQASENYRARLEACISQICDPPQVNTLSIV